MLSQSAIPWDVKAMSELIPLLIAISASVALILTGVILTGLLLNKKAGERWQALYNEFVDLSVEVIRWNLMVELKVFLDNHEEIDTPEKTNEFLRFAHGIKVADLEKAYDQYLLRNINQEIGAVA